MKLLGDPCERYIVPEGAKVKLREKEADDLSLCPDGGKSSTQALFDELRDEIQQLQKVLYAQGKHRVLVIIQAMDTGGKDGCVKHVFSRVDPQGIHVRSFKKPSENELAHDFLWRIHRHVPRDGEIMIFNRSHYEDIIAVRVKKLMPEKVWQQRYRHIVEFERMLAEEGTTILKLFLHISKDEQKDRLQKRLDNPAKHWKFNPDDLADRKRWDEFQQAYEDLIERTSKPWAPWYVIPADRKWYRNLCVARLFANTLERLDLKFPDIDFDPDKIVIGD
ncbi:polyphosphate kinase 2 family protein [Haloferula sp. A504]|uniref:polyphosphate kinase 2 family protein n=1 Tax=Haloferula sp. A504 TaxID=3373601 RepID=UPI0031C8391D|nr:polyphosphate kinase 2 family protein [Verrucomicrobiaceae bacterium E54]